MYKKETLANGVRIVTEEIPYVRSVSLGIWVGTGSRDEDQSNSGIAHFIEHMMFKGTAGRTAKGIAEALDAVGGQLNAFTSKEYTCYYAKVLDEHIDVAVDLLSDMYFNSLFREEDVEKEKNVIIEEIKMYEDTPDELVHDIFASTLWSDHALGKPVIGSEEIIRTIDREQMLHFRNNNYAPDSLVVAAAGNIKHEQVVAKLAPLFGTMPNTVVRNRIYSEPVAKYQIGMKKKDVEQVHLCVGTPGLPMEHEDIYVLHLINSVLGGGISSRLFQEIREERGLAYSIFSYHSSYKDAGLFSIYAGLSRNNLKQVLSLISTELNSIKKEGITSEEMVRAKEQLKGSILLGLENVSSRMTRLGKSELSINRVISVEETLEKIYKVSVEDVKRLADRLFRGDNIIKACVGPEVDENELELSVD
ncbi:M16 family metallopeptidase [Phosphitispora sp. TUW77]|uniref:M16 family metallopeptidase n=1 Tax=Phosphitispora sp. TUW77 TaxID=3152361 RepID=UPI003AB66AD7